MRKRNHSDSKQERQRGSDYKKPYSDSPYERKNPKQAHLKKTYLRKSEEPFDAKKGVYTSHSKQIDTYQSNSDFKKQQSDFQTSKSPYKTYPNKTVSKEIRLNRYIANTGYCSRREADAIIAEARVTINGAIVTEMGVKVSPKDSVLIDGKVIESQRKVYILLNKPKNCISTKKDPEGRKTVYDYIEGACIENIEAVGRLDRNTTGLLLFTNDGDLAHRLTHPKHEKMKIYHVFLNKNLKPDDFEKIMAGIEIDKEIIKPDDLQYVGSEKSQVGIQIHSGKYHIVKRIFEQVGYTVEKLDRVYFAGLTKKNLPRGKWRFLTDKEVSTLKQGAFE